MRIGRWGGLLVLCVTAACVTGRGRIVFTEKPETHPASLPSANPAPPAVFDGDCAELGESALILTAREDRFGGDVDLGVYVIDDAQSEIGIGAEFSDDGGLTWQLARIAPRHQGSRGLILGGRAFPGAHHRLVWDTQSDLAGRECFAMLRVFPALVPYQSSTIGLSISNPLAPALVDAQGGRLLNLQDGQEEAPPVPPVPPATRDPVISKFEKKQQFDIQHCYPGNLVLADLNNDKKLDLVLGDRNYGSARNAAGEVEWAFVVRIFKGKGNGEFETPSPHMVFTSGPVYGLKVADFDADGHQDIIVSCAGDPKTSDNAINIYRGNSQFGFTHWGSGGQPAGYYPVDNSKSASALYKPYALDLGDFNNDGKLDLVTANMQDDSVRGNDKNMSCFLQSQAGVLYQPLIKGTANFFVTDIAAGDFNKDQALDVAIGNQGDFGVLSIGYGTRDGKFLDHVAYKTATDNGMNGNNPQFVEVADVNNDDWPDIVCAGKRSHISVFINNQQGAFYPGVIWETDESSSFSSSICQGDLNGDRVVDFVITHPSDLFMTPFYGRPLEDGGKGSGEFTAPATLDGPANYMGMGCAMGDVNGDGKPDLVGALVRSRDQGSEGKVIVYVQK